MAAKEPTTERSIQSAEPLPAIPSPQQSGLPRDAAAQVPWPNRTPPNRTIFEEFARYPTIWEGHIICGLLNNEGVPATVTFACPGPDTNGYSTVWVDRELVHRAHWILAWPAPSEAELTFLATGEMGAENVADSEAR